MLPILNWINYRGGFLPAGEELGFYYVEILTILICLSKDVKTHIMMIAA